MTGRSLWIFVALALAALLALPTVATGAAGKAAEVRISIFEVEGSDGYEVTISSWREGDAPGDAVVQTVNDPLQAIYAVPANTGPGIHATFGSLGQLDVSFERRRKEIDHPAKGCRSITEEGVFRGAFQFTGEGGYFSSEAVDPKGEVWRLPDGFCIFDNFRRARPFLGIELQTLEAQARSEGRTITFGASRENHSPSAHLSATLSERVGEMDILRSVETHSGKATFSVTGRSHASVHPLGPFIGSARFRDPARQPATWTGSLTAPFPGTPAIALAGDDFVAKLCPRLSILARCLKRPPRGVVSWPRPTAAAPTPSPWRWPGFPR